MAVNLSPIWGAGAQLLDNSGNVLSGGKIYTYAAGTTTQVATYTSNSGITANSNPIVLNSAGRVPYEIWLTDGQNYKFVLKDSNDVLIGTWDNLSGINSNFVNYVNQQEIQTATAGQTVFNLTTMQYLPGTGNLSVFVDGVNQYGPSAQYAFEETDSNTVTFASGLHVGALVKFTSTQIQNSGVADASQITYTYPAANAVTESVEARLAQYVSVKDFGAVGDGVTDDTTAITNAIVAANNIGGGVVTFPAGNYICKNVPLLSNVTIEASGATITKKSDALDTEPIFNANGSVSSTVTTLTANALLNATSIAVTSTSGFAAGDLVLVYSNDYAYSTYGRNQEMQKIKSISGNTIYFYGGLIGAYLTSSSASVAIVNAIQNCHIDGGTYVIASGTKGGGFQFNYGYGCSIKNVDLSGMDYYGGILLQRSAFVEISDNFIHDGQNSALGGDQGFPLYCDESTQNVTITGNRFKNYNQISLTNGSKFIVFDGNDCSGIWDSGINTHGAGVYNVIISNNLFIGSQQYGIAVGFGTHNAGDRQITISGNTIKFVQYAGISCNAPAGKENQDVNITNNTISYTGLAGVNTTAVGITNTISTNFANNIVEYFDIGTAVSFNTVTIGCIESNIVNNVTNGYGISIYNCNNVAVQNNKTANISSYGFRAYGTNTNCQVLNNTSDVAINSIGTDVQTWGNSFQTFTGSATYDPPSLADGSGVTTTVTCTGASLGGYAAATFSLDLQGVTVTAWVSSSNTVSVRFQNESGGVVDLASGTLRVRVSNAIGA